MRKHSADKSANKAGHLGSGANATHEVAPAKHSSISPQSAEHAESLTAKEQKLLVECEDDIKTNLQGAFVLGFRLEQIRDGRLYRATHKTFAQYCSERWDFSKTHANRLIQAHLCSKHLKALNDADVYVPTKESQVRLICDLKPEEQAKVAAKVKEKVGDKEATAGDFGEVRQELYPKPKREVQSFENTNEASEDAKTGSKVMTVTFDTTLVSLSELKKRADHLYNIYTNSSKKQEALKIIGTLQRDLDAWADWQQEKLDQQEAA